MASRLDGDAIGSLCSSIPMGFISASTPEDRSDGNMRSVGASHPANEKWLFHGTTTRPSDRK